MGVFLSGAPTDSLNRLIGWYRREALPLWVTRAYDRVQGGFFEALDFAGNPVAGAARRVRVQARQIHTFAHAARLGWSREAEELALSGFDHFYARCCPDDGARGCVHLLTPRGEVSDDRRDLYDQAFLLLACAALWGAFREPRALALAERTVAFLERELAASAGGFHEDDRASLPRRQNPHMHLFEALMALHEATGDQKWLERAGAIFQLFEERFFDPRRRVLREYFADDLSAAPGPQGAVFEPGHMAEWVWLLGRFEKLDGAEAGTYRAALFESAIRLGSDASGFLVDKVAEGEPASGTRRLWPQTEYVKACLTQARAGDDTALARAAATIDALFASYLDQKIKGLWCDQYDGSGAPVARDVPASILYHLFETVQEAQSYLSEQQR